MKPSYIVFTGLVCIVPGFLSCNLLDADNTISAASMGEKNNFSIGGDIITSEGSLNPHEYIRWIQKHLCQERNAGNLKFELQYKSYDYIACLESGSDQIPDSLRKAIGDELDGLEYFDLRIDLIAQGGELLKFQLLDDADYQRRVKYYAYEFARDISITSTFGDPVHPVLFHFERTYDVTSFCTFSLAFPRDQIDYSKQLIIEIYDRIFSSQVISFDFKESKLHQLPKLKTL